MFVLLATLLAVCCYVFLTIHVGSARADFALFAVVQPQLSISDGFPVIVQIYCTH